jgi:hypothetical protein
MASRWYRSDTVVALAAVLGLIAIVLCLAMPNRIRRGTSPRNICINNLRQIDGAKEIWASENQKLKSSVVSSNSVAALIKGGFPKCPQGGYYTLGRIGEPPTCTVPGHSLP